MKKNERSRRKSYKIKPGAFKLTKEEQAIEDSIEEFVPGSKKECDEIVAALEAYKKNSVLSIRINRNDHLALKKKAKKLGVPYQSFIGECLRRLAQG